MQYKNIIISLLFVLLATNTYAQVTIGSSTKPEEFSTVQVELDGIPGGVTLPSITNASKNDAAWKAILTASNASSGLVVYNSDTKNIEYWDGTTWITLTGSLKVDNGLTKTATNVVKLGGDLTDASTAIDQNGNSFNIQQSAGEKLEVNALSATGVKEATTLSIANAVIDMAPKTALTVNNNAITVTNQSVDIQSPNFQINVDNGDGTATTKMKMDATELLLDASFHYQKTETDNDNSGYLLTADNTGKTSWGPLRPLGAVIEGRLNDNQTFLNAQVNITLKNIILPAGQWMIFAQCNTVTKVPSDLKVMYNWLELAYKAVGSSSITRERVGGTNPETKPYNQEAFATPSFSYYMNVKAPTEVWLEAVSSNNYNTNQTTTAPFLGPSYFFAVRLDGAIE